MKSSSSIISRTDEKSKVSSLVYEYESLLCDNSINLNKENKDVVEQEQRIVYVSTQFLRIGEIDTMNEKYYAEVSIEANWLEKNFTRNYYDSKIDWNPKLYIENTLLEPKEEITYEVQRSKDSVKIKETRYVRGFFWEKLELQNFPVDIQELSIVLTSKLRQNEIELKADPEKMSTIDYKASRIFVDQQKWKLYRFVKVSNMPSYDLPSTFQSIVDHNYAVYKAKCLQTQSKFVATCFCTRKPGYYFFNGYLIIFLITALSLTVFSIDCKFPQNRLQTSFTLVLTSASFKWVINRSLPTLSYMTSLDKYAIVCIIYLCLLCVWHSIVGSFWERDLARKLDLIILLIAFIVFIIIHIAYTIWLFKAYKLQSALQKENDKYNREIRSNMAKV